MSREVSLRLGISNDDVRKGFNIADALGLPITLVSSESMRLLPYNLSRTPSDQSGTHRNLWSYTAKTSSLSNQWNHDYCYCCCFVPGAGGLRVHLMAFVRELRKSIRHVIENVGNCFRMRCSAFISLSLSPPFSSFLSFPPLVRSLRLLYVRCACLLPPNSYEMDFKLDAN